MERGTVFAPVYPPRVVQIAWLVLVLLMAAFLGYQGAAVFLASRELAAANEAKRDAEANVAQTSQLLRQVQDAMRKQALEAPQERDRAGQVSRL